MMSSVIPASAKNPFAMPIYQGQPTALAAPIMPVEMVSAALTGGAANKASAQQDAPKICGSRDEAMAVPSELLSALLVSRCAPLTLPVSFSLRQCGAAKPFTQPANGAAPKGWRGTFAPPRRSD